MNLKFRLLGNGVREMSDEETSGSGFKPLPNVADGAIANADNRRDDNAATSIGDFTESLGICAISHSDSTYCIEVSQ